MKLFYTVQFCSFVNIHWIQPHALSFSSPGNECTKKSVEKLTHRRWKCLLCSTFTSQIWLKEELSSWLSWVCLSTSIIVFTEQTSIHCMSLRQTNCQENDRSKIFFSPFFLAKLHLNLVLFCNRLIVWLSRWLTSPVCVFWSLSYQLWLPWWVWHIGWCFISRIGPLSLAEVIVSAHGGPAVTLALQDPIIPFVWMMKTWKHF